METVLEALQEVPLDPFPIGQNLRVQIETPD